MSQGRTGFTRLHSVTVSEPKYRLCQNYHFLVVKKRPVKTVIFRQKAYLILIVFAKSVIFDVFAEKPLILVLFGTPLVYGCFSLFRDCQVFPRDLVIFSNLYIIYQKFTNFGTFPRNVTDKPDTSKSGHFRHFSMKKLSILTLSSRFG